MTYQLEKFLNAVLFFGKNTDPQKFGITKLLKLLFLADFSHYKKYGRPIIGDSYVRLPQGPVPSTSYNLYSSFKEGEDSPLRDVVRITPIKIRDYTLEKLEVLREYDPRVFSKSDLDVLKTISEKFYSSEATQMVKDIHKIGFVDSATTGSPIGYQQVLEQDTDREYAKQLEQESGWLVKTVSR